MKGFGRFCSDLIVACIFFSAVIFLSACTSTTNSGLEVGEYNKPAIYWYQRMLREIRIGDLEKADSYYTSLQSEHVNSPLLPEAMLILGRAHMNSEEYLLATFYFDEFIKRFGDSSNIDFANYLKLQANYFAFTKKNRDQQLLLDSIQQAQDFSDKYPYSRYKPFVDTMLLKLELANVNLSKEIIRLYSRRKKDGGVEFYKQQIDETGWIKEIPQQEAKTNWYEQIFNW